MLDDRSANRLDDFLIIAAAELAGVKLKVVGHGPDLPRLLYLPAVLFGAWWIRTQWHALKPPLPGQRGC